MNAAQLGGGGDDYAYVRTLLASGSFTAPKSGFYQTIVSSISRELHPCAVPAQPYPLPATL